MKKEVGGQNFEFIKNRVFTTILITDVIQQDAIWIRNISVMFFYSFFWYRYSLKFRYILSNREAGIR